MPQLSLSSPHLYSSNQGQVSVIPRSLTLRSTIMSSLRCSLSPLRGSWHGRSLPRLPAKQLQLQQQQRTLATTPTLRAKNQIYNSCVVPPVPSPPSLIPCLPPIARFRVPLTNKHLWIMQSPPARRLPNLPLPLVDFPHTARHTLHDLLLSILQDSPPPPRVSSVLWCGGSRGRDSILRSAV